MAPFDVCSPSRAARVLGAAEQSFLDLIAYAEVTEQLGASGCNVMSTGHTIVKCIYHHNQSNCSGGLCATAAGCYPFLYKTWTSLKRPTFKPENQTRGVVTLMKRRNVTLPIGRALTSVEFASVLDKLSYEWASLPPSRYGQTHYTKAQLWQRYQTEVGN